MGDIVKTVGQVAGATLDPLNISGHGGIPGLNSGGNGLIGEFNGANARDKALQAQTLGANQGNQVLSQQYQNQQGYLKPYNEAGTSALGQLSDNSFMNNWQQDPGYQFQLSEGNKAINNSAAARGMGNSGSALKALTAYGQNMASNEYDKVYNRESNRLSQLAGYGQNAANNLVNASANYGNSMSNNYMGLGNANASAQIAQGNANSQLLGQGIQGAAAFFSDELLKTNIEPVSKEDLAEMKKHLKAFAFNYKSDEHGKGDWVGVMAQDLQKSKLGKTLVIQDESGKLQLSVPKIMSLFLATMAEA